MWRNLYVVLDKAACTSVIQEELKFILTLIYVPNIIDFVVFIILDRTESSKFYNQWTMVMCKC